MQFFRAAFVESSPLIDTPGEFIFHPVALDGHGPAGQAKDATQAMNEGWLITPSGRAGTYTRKQFEAFHRHLALHPSIELAQSCASKFMDGVDQLWKRPLFELFGRPSSNRLRDPANEARGIQYRCPRMPIDFKAGTIGPADYCDLINDISHSCERIISYVDALQSPGMLDPACDLAAKTERLRELDQIELLPALAHSVHGIYLGRDGSRVLRQVMYNGGGIEAFLQFIDNRESQNKLESEKSWKRTFKQVSMIAGVLCEAKSYHQGTLTRQLHVELGGAYSLVRTKTPNGVRMHITMDGYLELGNTAGLSEEFELVNWVIALDANLSGAPHNIYGFLDASSKADAAIIAMRSELAA